MRISRGLAPDTPEATNAVAAANILMGDSARGRQPANAQGAAVAALPLQRIPRRATRGGG